jgi:hypothetical protein
MNGCRGIVALLFAMVLGALCFDAAPLASADLPAWNGKYSLVRYAAQKTGTSLAARQPEPTFSDDYDFVTTCSATACVATVSGGPKPKIPTLPQPPEYTWDGSKWLHIYDWQWDCYMGEGVPKQWNPARSWAFYTPQPDGSLRGTWQTNIYSGPCYGTVVMDVAAFAVT